MIAGIFSNEPWWLDAVFAACLTIVYAVYRFTGGPVAKEEAMRMNTERLNAERHRKGRP